MGYNPQGGIESDTTERLSGSSMPFSASYCYVMFLKLFVALLRRWLKNISQ